MHNSPGIFNDVIGPVMRGPSSSHTAASWRAAKMAMDYLNEPLSKAIIDFDKDGAWSPNYREQGTTLGIDGGLLELEMTDDRMKYTERIASERGISIIYEINSFPTNHVNTVRLSLEGTKGRKVQVLAASLGGGSFEIQKLDGFEVNISGGYYELVLINPASQSFPDDLENRIGSVKAKRTSQTKTRQLLNLKFSEPLSERSLDWLSQHPQIDEVLVLKPVLPVIAGNKQHLPFDTVEEMIQYAGNNYLDLGDLGLLYEQYQSGLTEEEVSAKMQNIIDIIHGSITTGLAGTTYHDRILPQQSHLIHKAQREKKILQNKLIGDIVANVSAIMESKSAMEVVVANPTAGSCGAVGGVLKAVADDLGATREDLLKAYFAAGLVGVYFAKGPGFSAEEHGCQVECGASAGMAAAGIAQLFGGSTRQAVGAASMAIQNMIGLVCDPVADRVEVPCLGKNISAAMNALSSATMACSGYNPVIPLEEVIETVSRVSAQMPTCVKCTGKGGLAITKTAYDLKVVLANGKPV
jgi:L-serine dehydratase